MKSRQWQYGLHAVQALLKTSPGRILALRVQKGRQDERLNRLLQMAGRHGIPVAPMARKEMDRVAEGRHQGVMALCRGAEVRDENYLAKLLAGLDRPPFLLVLDGVADPHNLGACLRSADAAGVDAVIAPKDRSAGITPTVGKVACGAAETMPFVVVTNLARALEALRQGGVWVVGTAGEAGQVIYEADLKGPLAIVMGAEGKGMRRLTREHCDSLVKLPMAGELSSLNVSVAAGVCLFEAVRQRR